MNGSSLLIWSAAGLLGAGAIGPSSGAGAAGAVPRGGPAAEVTFETVGALPGSATEGTITLAIAEDSTRVELAIEGMTCGSCATTAKIILKRIRGVYDAEVSYDSANAIVVYDADVTGPETFIEELARMAGYEGRVVGEPQKLTDRPNTEGEGPGT